MKMKKLIILLVLLMTVSGCTWLGGFKPDKIVKHPRATMMIEEVRGDYVLVALYHEVKKEWITYGWVELDEQYEGWFIAELDLTDIE